MEDLPVVAHADRSLPGNLELGSFSVSLAVADLERSKAFYETLGFEATGGSTEANYLIMMNGEAMIGLFQGMFEGNILTFNPGLTPRMERLEDFTDVRDIAAALTDAGVELTTALDSEAGDSGPAHIALVDPDGNAILIDQHV